MRIFYLTGALFFTVIILIISFENLGAQCNMMYVFFTSINSQTSPTILIFIFSLVGMFAGAFYFGFIQSLFRGSSSSDDEGGDEDAGF